MNKPIIMVVDGQGGGLGRELIEQVLIQLPTDVFSYNLIACGTNVLATQAMLKAGANLGASGENAIIYNASKADFILGPSGILAGNSLLGELSPAMATAIGSSKAYKYIIPINLCRIRIADNNTSLPQRIEACVNLLVNDFKALAKDELNNF